MSSMATELTEDRKRVYLEHGGLICPFCGSRAISTQEFNADHAEGWQDVYCEDCEGEWRDLYTLTGVEER